MVAYPGHLGTKHNTRNVMLFPLRTWNPSLPHQGYIVRCGWTSTMSHVVLFMKSDTVVSPPIL